MSQDGVRNSVDDGKQSEAVKWGVQIDHARATMCRLYGIPENVMQVLMEAAWSQGVGEGIERASNAVKKSFDNVLAKAGSQ